MLLLSLSVFRTASFLIHTAALAYSSDLPAARKLQMEGRYAESEALYRRILQTGDYLPRDEAKLYNNLGSVVFEAGRPAEAEPLVLRAIRLWENDAGPDALRLGAAYNNLGAIQRGLGRVSDAEASYRKALEMLRGAGEVDALAPVLSNLGTLYAADRRRYAEAEAFHRQALDIREQQQHSREPGAGPDPSSLGNSYTALAQLLHSSGRFEEAEPLYREALRLHEASMPPGHPQLARDRANLAFLYRSTNRLVEAEALYIRALVDLERSVGKEHSDYAATLNNIAQVRAAVGDWKTAAKLFQQAIGIWERSLGPDHPNTASGLANLAGLLRMQKRYNQAAQLLRRAVTIDVARLGEQHPRTAEDQGNLGVICFLKKNFAEARIHLEKAWETKRRLFGGSSVEAAQARADVAELYRVTRREQDAVLAFREALAVLERAWHRDDIRFLRILGNFEQALLAQEEFAEAERVGVWSTRIRVRQTLAANRR